MRKSWEFHLVQFPEILSKQRAFIPLSSCLSLSGQQSCQPWHNPKNVTQNKTMQMQRPNCSHHVYGRVGFSYLGADEFDPTGLLWRDFLFLFQPLPECQWQHFTAVCGPEKKSVLGTLQKPNSFISPRSPFISSYV